MPRNDRCLQLQCVPANQFYRQVEIAQDAPLQLANITTLGSGSNQRHQLFAMKLCRLRNRCFVINSSHTCMTDVTSSQGLGSAIRLSPINAKKNTYLTTTWQIHRQVGYRRDTSGTVQSEREHTYRKARGKCIVESTCTSLSCATTISIAQSCKIANEKKSRERKRNGGCRKKRKEREKQPPSFSLERAQEFPRGCRRGIRRATNLLSRA